MKIDELLTIKRGNKYLFQESEWYIGTNYKPNDPKFFFNKMEKLNAIYLFIGEDQFGFISPEMSTDCEFCFKESPKCDVIKADPHYNAKNSCYVELKWNGEIYNQPKHGSKHDKYYKLERNYIRYNFYSLCGQWKEELIKIPYTREVRVCIGDKILTTLRIPSGEDFGQLRFMGNLTAEHITGNMHEDECENYIKVTINGKLNED